jgi:hypothetical protein
MLVVLGASAGLATLLVALAMPGSSAQGGPASRPRDATTPLGRLPARARVRSGRRGGRRARLPAYLRGTLPFPAPQALRAPRAAESLPSLYGDGRVCSVGCRPFGALSGWPIRPFHRQHPLRAGLNELRPQSLHVGLDVQARDGTAVFAVQPGAARVLAATGPDARVQVGNYVYWHITPAVRSGEPVVAFRTLLGRVKGGYGHLAFSELSATGAYVNPLRPGGRVLTPWVDRLAPVVSHPSVAPDGAAVLDAYDPQSFVRRTTYRTPVLAPAAIAYRLYDRHGGALTALLFAFRGTHLLPWSERRAIFAPGARSPGFQCFARRALCRPHWRYWLAGGLAPRLPTGLAPGRYRLTVYAWDWADNRSALDTTVWMTARGWRPRGRVPAVRPIAEGSFSGPLALGRGLPLGLADGARVMAPLG